MNLLRFLTLLCLVDVVYAWHLVMKIPNGNLGGFDGVYDLWTSNNTLNEDQDNPLNVSPGTAYKSRDIINWDDKTIKMVKVAFYVGGVEEAYVTFGAEFSAFNQSTYPGAPREPATLTSWFDCTRILDSSWRDLKNTSTPDNCVIHSNGTIQMSYSILRSPLRDHSDCDNITGWFTVMEPASQNSATTCDWIGTPPHTLFSPGFTSLHISRFRTADVLAIFVDDCIDEVLCRHGNCSQTLQGRCDCHGYKCTEACSDLPCGEDEECVTDLNDESQFICEACKYGSIGVRCAAGDDDGLGAGAIAGIVIGVVVFVALIGGGVWCFYNWRHKEDEMSHKAAVAKDFVRRSVHRLSGRQHQFPRRQLKEENPSPQVKGKSEQLSPDSSVVFGEVNPAFDADEPIEPPTPPVDRRYTEFPTRQGAVEQPPVLPPTTAVSTSEIKLHENRHIFQKSGRPTSAEVYNRRHYENTPGTQGDNQRTRDSGQLEYDRASTIGSFEKASTMSELSDATSTSGYSDYTGDTPANLPPSEMISKDIINRHGHHRHRPKSRPRSRASTADPPKTIVAPQTVENQIKYAMERSRSSISSLSSLSSDATHRSDVTQRSGEVTKSDALRARYENFGAHQGENLGKFPRLEGMTYADIKKQLDADMKKREERERKEQLEMEREAEFEAQRNKHRMRQVESLDSGIDAEQSREDRQNDGRLEIVRTRSADQLDKNAEIRFTSREATV